MDSEDAIHLATAVTARCSHFATSDPSFRRSLDNLKKNKTCMSKLQEMDNEWRIPIVINPSDKKTLDELAWSGTF
jgi:hypothetical protein